MVCSRLVQEHRAGLVVVFVGILVYRGEEAHGAPSACPHLLALPLPLRQPWDCITG